MKNGSVAPYHAWLSRKPGRRQTDSRQGRPCAVRADSLTSHTRPVARLYDGRNTHRFLLLADHPRAGRGRATIRQRRGACDHRLIAILLGMGHRGPFRHGRTARWVARRGYHQAVKATSALWAGLRRRCDSLSHQPQDHPRTHRSGYQNTATLGLSTGFVLMLFLDVWLG